ncbi:hypothetical protein [Brevundimonas denitrificans]|uniref:hypothetical protein n=1 Tax=Brevundimonas denitrificans TaxID=1443434 RepID=UPI0024E0F2B1|nr:hypothetical protein [Brevundimonas denitrificans]
MATVVSYGCVPDIDENEPHVDPAAEFAGYKLSHRESLGAELFRDHTGVVTGPAHHARLLSGLVRMPGPGLAPDMKPQDFPVEFVPVDGRQNMELPPGLVCVAEDQHPPALAPAAPWHSPVPKKAAQTAQMSARTIVETCHSPRNAAMQELMHIHAWQAPILIRDQK